MSRRNQSSKCKKPVEEDSPTGFLVVTVFTACLPALKKSAMKLARHAKICRATKSNSK